MLNLIFKNIELGEGLDIDITGKVVTIDFRKRLMASNAGNFKVGRLLLIDSVGVTGLKLMMVMLFYKQD